MNSKCDNCGGTEWESSSKCVWDAKYIGSLSVEIKYGEYWFCKNCKDERISYSLVKRVEQAEQERIEQLLLVSANCDFKKFKEELLTTRELAELLGMSEQAVYRTRQLRTLIFHVIEKSGKMSYWKKSAEQYKQTGDGGFDLTEMFYLR